MSEVFKCAFCGNYYDKDLVVAIGGVVPYGPRQSVPYTAFLCVEKCGPLVSPPIRKGDYSIGAK